MFKCLATVLGLLALFASSVSTQVPTKQGRVFINSVTQTDACGASQETWQIMAGTCASPGTTPWISTLRLNIGSAVVNIPRANVTRLTTSAECTPNPAPCLRSLPVTIPAGNVTIRFVTNTGEEGGPSAAVPFSPTADLPSVPGMPRVEVVP